MKNKLMLVGFGGVLAIILCFGSGQTSSSNTGGSNERFKMFSPPQSSGATEIYVIDSQTGRIWRRIFFSDIKGFYFAPLPYLTADELAVSALPTDTVALESLSMQKRYDREIDQARQKKSEQPEK